MTKEKLFTKTRWKFKGGDYELDSNFLIVGVLNLTPDSFYDGGKYKTLSAAMTQAKKMVEEGADIIDVGGESTRPGAEEIPAELQITRISETVKKLVEEGIIVSVDTRKKEVAEKMLDIGAKIINDVSGLGDVSMPNIVARYGAGLVVMHIKGTPKTMQENPNYVDTVHEVKESLRKRTELAVNAGINPSSIIIDPGIGFGKRAEDNLKLISETEKFLDLGFGIMLGISRKSFLGAVNAGEKPAERLAGTLAMTALAYERGARIFRTHDTGETKKALFAAKALINIEKR